MFIMQSKLTFLFSDCMCYRHYNDKSNFCYQILTCILLTIRYRPSLMLAFGSKENPLIIIVLKQIGIYDVHHSQGHFLLYRSPSFLLPCLFSIHSPSFRLSSYQMTWCSACSDRSSVCLCLSATPWLLRWRKWCATCARPKYVQGNTGSCDRSLMCWSITDCGLIWSCWIGFDRRNSSVTSIESHYWLLGRKGALWIMMLFLCGM